MKSPFNHRFMLILLIGCASIANSATLTNTPPGGLLGMATRALAVPKQEAIDELPTLVKSNSAAGTDLGIGASSIVRQEIHLLEDGAGADYGLIKVSFPADITEAPITIITAAGRKLSCRATFLAVREDATGQSQLLGQVTNSIGVLVGDNTVVYPQ